MDNENNSLKSPPATTTSSPPEFPPSSPNHHQISTSSAPRKAQIVILPASTSNNNNNNTNSISNNIGNNNTKNEILPPLPSQTSKKLQHPTTSSSSNNNNNNNTNTPTSNTISQVAQEKVVAPLIQFATQTALRLFSTSRNVKRLSPIWSLIGSCILGYLLPIFYPSNTVILSIVGVLFFLVGLSVPIREWASTFLNPVKATHIVFVFVAQFLIAPTVTIIALYFLRWFSCGTAGTLARAMAVAAATTLPPSPSLSATLTNIAGGSDGFAFLISTLINTIGIVLVPFLAQLTVAAAGLEETQTPGKRLGVSLREATQLISYLVLTTLIPIGFGAAVQSALLSSSSSNAKNNANFEDSSSEFSSVHNNNNNYSDSLNNSLQQQQQTSSSTSASLSTSASISIPGDQVDTSMVASTFVAPSNNNNNNKHRFSSLIQSCCPPTNANNNNNNSENDSLLNNNSKKDHHNQNNGISLHFEDDNQFSEFCGGRFIFSRSKIRQWIGVVSFFLRYCCFILMFQQSQMMENVELSSGRTSFSSALADPSSLLSWGQLLKTFIFSLLIVGINAVIFWFFSTVALFFASSYYHQTSSTNNNSNNNTSLSKPSPSSNIHNNNNKNNHNNNHHHHHRGHNSQFQVMSQQQQVEDRIALFISSMQKADLLIAPIFSQLFVSRIEGRVVVLMSHAFIFCFANTLVLALLAVGPLKEWKRRQLCRPGASFLPAKFSKVPAHHSQLAPTSSNSLHSGIFAATASKLSQSSSLVLNNLIQNINNNLLSSSSNKNDQGQLEGSTVNNNSVNNNHSSGDAVHNNNNVGEAIHSNANGIDASPSATTNLQTIVKSGIAAALRTATIKPEHTKD